MYCLHLQGLVSPRLKIHSKCHDPVTLSQSSTSTNHQILSNTIAKRPQNSVSPSSCHPHKVAGLKKTTFFSLEIKLEPMCLECTTTNIYIHKISVILIYMIKYSSLQLLCKPFICSIGMTSTQKKEYTRSPKPHSK